MKKNEYSSLNAFIAEYADGKSFSWQNQDGIEKFMGIEFYYKGHYYRLCREPIDCVPSDEKGRFHVMEMIMKDEEYPMYDHYVDIGWYRTLNDVLKECKVQGIPFSSVIISDDTEILSKD